MGGHAPDIHRAAAGAAVSFLKVKLPVGRLWGPHHPNSMAARRRLSSRRAEPGACGDDAHAEPLLGLLDISLRPGRVRSNHPNHAIPSHPAGRQAEPVEMATKGDLMGKHARIGLLLGASACLLAAMVDWVVEELNQDGNPSAGKLATSFTTCPAAAAHSAAGHRAGGHVTKTGPRSAGSASGSASRRLPPRSGPPLSGRLAGCPRRSPW